MRTPYTNSIRRGMPKSRGEQEALYEGIVRGLVIAGLTGGALIVVVQFFIWASDLASKKFDPKADYANQAAQVCDVEFRKVQRPCNRRE